MVLPHHLLAGYRALYASYASTVSRFEQQTLCRFIQGGYFTRHLARMRKEYKARAAALEARLEAVFGPGRLRLLGRQAGLHMLAQLPGGPGEAQMTARARAQGVRLAGLSSYYLARAERCPPNTVVLGYGALDAAQLGPLAQALGRAWGAREV